MTTAEIIAVALDDKGRDLTVKEARDLVRWVRGCVLFGSEEQAATSRDVCDALDFLSLAGRAMDRASDHS